MPVNATVDVGWWQGAWQTTIGCAGERALRCFCIAFSTRAETRRQRQCWAFVTCKASCLAITIGINSTEHAGGGLSQRVARNGQDLPKLAVQHAAKASPYQLIVKV